MAIDQSHITSTEPATKILAEEREWESRAKSLLGENAQLVSVSSYIGDSRTYTDSDQIAKIRSLRAHLPKGVHRLRHEAEIMKRIGLRAEYSADDNWEYLLLDRAEGHTIDPQFLTTRMSIIGKTRLLIRIRSELSKLHSQGIAHRDVRPENVLIKKNGSVMILDFDRAVAEKPWKAAVDDLIGFPPPFTAANPFLKFALFLYVPKLQSLAARIRTRLFGAKPVVQSDLTSQELVTLSEAWRTAQSSRANAVGQGLAYYAFTYEGCHFAGERPWYLRWDAIHRAVDFNGKKFVELGCNMGMLSTFARLHGADEAIGVDADAEVIKSAQLVASALHSGARFRQVNLVTDMNWESELGGGDIVAALSLIHWLPNKERVLDFLGHHAEVIYEGHDSLETETDRLRSVGFDDVQVLLETERNRHVLYGRNTSRLHS